MHTRVRRVLIVASVVIGILLLAGATYQGVATALERRHYPRPGGLVDVGDHQLHIYCSGEGSPTVVLEAPATGMSVAWAWIQPEVARVTRVCSYDRAGLGWSEASGRPFEPGRVAEELHALLANARETGPYVVAGHSLGAAFARLYAARYPQEAAALVEIDPAAPSGAPDPQFFAISPWLARTGMLRATGALAHAADGLPEPSGGAVRSFLNRPDHLTRTSRELERWDDAVHLAETAALPATLLHTVVRIDPRAMEDGNEDGPAFLTDRAAANRVTSAILDMVATVRASREPPKP